MKRQKSCGPCLGKLVHQLPGVVTFAYDLRFRRVIARWKGIVEEIHFGGSIMPSTIIENIYLKKTSFRPSKWPQKLKPTKNSKLSKWPENCFEPFGKCGWPSISTWIKNIAFKFKVLFLLLFSYHFSAIMVNVLVILLLFCHFYHFIRFCIHFISGILHNASFKPCSYDQWCITIFLTI